MTIRGGNRGMALALRVVVVVVVDPNRQRAHLYTNRERIYIQIEHVVTDFGNMPPPPPMTRNQTCLKRKAEHPLTMTLALTLSPVACITQGG